ncbi:MAG TPA: hypothetical protein GXX20_09530 [Clostridiaceae bacterium]|nr:hypothetical protein [Clostridiaceae bacterium]
MNFIGLIGAGKIARNLMKIMKDFSTKKIICYHSYVIKDIERQFNIKMVDTIEEILSSLEIISAYVSLTKETEGPVNKNLFLLMKPDAIFMNTSRGGVVNEDYLYEGLKNGKSATAGLDVVVDDSVKRNNRLFE